MAPSDGTVIDTVPIPGGATGLTLTSNLDAPRLYVATGATLTVLKLSAEGAAHTDAARRGDDPDARPRDQGHVRRCVDHDPRARHDEGRQREHDLRRRASRWPTRQLRLCRRPTAVRPGGLDHGRPARLPERRPADDPDLRRRGRGRQRGRRDARVQLAGPRGHRRRAHRGPAVPADPDALPAPIGRRARGDPGPRRRDAVRPVADRDERRLRGVLHRSPRTSCSPACGPAAGGSAARSSS